ncbi:hypothetical protein CW749_22085 [Vibrio sp. vnigr-6D03]|uniref:Macrodomain Ori protein n=1 Tax=Vibrio penaeicida TaxID=104609 RepID=A0AAV5NR21_9VIBR|nr:MULTISPECIES: DUF413 domain-containing protein [Vibrio]PKF77394.1 hypothetical protein CW749_22085 [Vibrio sp. vnigr-6D03]RTZ22589.1 DUF413 domain-containing protein [Vibrio penaeicida]GLQ73110.1 hypothetical protein GCM10007932_24700 [Vibrio penaeicida]
MSDIEVRVGQKRFFDNKKFPRGFGKSGDFTLMECDLLTTYGDTLNALQHGELEPENSEEKHFLKVLENPGKAKTKLENVWLKYHKIAYGRRTFHTLHTIGKQVEEESEELITIDDE